MLSLGLGLGLARGSASSEGLALAGATIPDNAAAGTQVGTLLVPEGYTAEILYSENGRFTVDGNQLKVGTTLLYPGDWRPTIRAKKEGALDLTLRPTVIVSSARAPSDLSGLLAAWVCDQGLTVDESDRVTAWAAAFGTSVNLTSPGDSTSPTRVLGYGRGGAPGIHFANTQFMSMSAALSSLGAWI